MGKFKDWLKRSKILSSAASLIPFAGPAISNSIENMGYGKRRRRGRVARHRVTRMSQFTPDGRFLGDTSSMTGGGTVKFRTKSGKVVSFHTRKRKGAGLGSLFKKGWNKIRKIATKDNITRGIEKAKEINNTLKDKKYISDISGKVGTVANTLGLSKIGDIANKISSTASNYGYGKRRRRHRGGKRFGQNGGLRLPMNGGSKIRSIAITKPPSNRPILNGLAKPCGFNHRGLYNPQNSLQSFLAYKLTT